MVPVAAQGSARREKRHELAWCTATLQALSFRFAVRSNEEGEARCVGALLSSLRAPGHADHMYSLVVQGSRVEVFLDDRLLLLAESRAHAVAWLLWHISQTAVDASSEHLLIHAAALETANGVLLLPAPADAGKTTLTAALIRAGLGYLTDEVVALSPEDHVLPFPRPLTLEPESLAALAALDPAAPSWSAVPEVRRNVGRQGNPDEWTHIPVANIRPSAMGQPSAPRVVVFPRYQPDVTTRLEPAGTADSLLELATNAFNLERHGGNGLARLARLAEECSCFRLHLSELADACRLVLTVAPAP
jgi:hypothetical protein